MTATRTDQTRTSQAGSVVERFLAGIEAGELSSDLYTADATLDATVPGWRFQAHGAEAILREYGRWFADPCRFHTVERHSLPDGELVRYVQDYELDDMSFTVHHMHHLTIVGGKIARDVVFCGGRWGTEVLTEMGAAAHAT